MAVILQADWPGANIVGYPCHLNISPYLLLSRDAAIMPA